MISITAEEKKEVQKSFPDVHIVRTMKQDSKRHHYYMTEDRAPMRFLLQMREDALAKSYMKGRVGNRSSKASK